MIGFVAAPNAVARNILLSVGASFVAAGFVSWAILRAKELTLSYSARGYRWRAILRAKELTMAIADWMREAPERRRERIIAEVVQSDEYRQVYDEGFRQGLVEGYLMGYEDRDKGKPRRPPSSRADRDGDGNGDGGASE